jgi:tRNA(Ile2) C34 agmatinyltransferase TiaS
MQGYLLPRCPCCGQHYVAAHTKYTDRCVDCGKRYSRYANYKWHLKQPRYSVKIERLLGEVMTEYRELKRLGFKVPKDVI